MNTRNYDVRIAVYESVNSKHRVCNICFGNGIDFREELGSDFVEVRILKSTVEFIPHDTFKRGTTVCVANNKIQIASDAEVDLLEVLRGEFPLRFREDGTIYIDMNEQTMLTENARPAYRKTRDKNTRTPKRMLRDGYAEKDKQNDLIVLVESLPARASRLRLDGVLYLSSQRYSIEDTLKIARITCAKQIRFDLHRKVVL